MDEAPDAVLLVDGPLPKVRRLTLNRPDKRNALNDELRLALFEALRAADADESVSVAVIRGAGGCFSAGYDLVYVADDARIGYPPVRSMSSPDMAWQKVPLDLLALNKRVCHRALETAGIRDGLRATAELNALGFHQRSSKEYMRSFKEKGVRANLSERDRSFGDYRQSK